jgi:DNA segregation ATPase FtsK/SpoIIIE, S-DNA-T family
VTEATEEQTPPTDVSPLPPPVAADARTPRDVQRSALRDLVALATECATTETEVELRFQKSTEQLNKELDTAVWSIQQRHLANADKVRQKHEERRTAIDAKFNADAGALKVKDEAARDRIARENDPPQRDLRQKYDQAVWLADSVFESTQAQLREDLKKKREEINAQLGQLNEMEGKAAALLHRYGVPPPLVEAVAAPQGSGADPDAAFAAGREASRGALDRLGSLVSARLLVGIKPYVLLLVLLAGAGAGAQFYLAATRNLEMADVQWKPVGIAVGAALVVAIFLGVLLQLAAKSSTRKLYTQFGQSLLAARAAADDQLAAAQKVHDERLAAAQRQRGAEVQVAKERIGPMIARLKTTREAALATAAAEHQKQLAVLTAQRDAAVAELDDWKRRAEAEAEQKKQRDEQLTKARHQQRTQEIRQQYGSSRTSLEQRLKDGLAHTQAPIEDTGGVLGQGAPEWSRTDWARWTPPKQFASVVRFGELEVNLRQIADSVPRTGELKLQLPPAYSVPALLGFPKQASLLVQTDRAGRNDAIRVLQMVMTRLLTSLPPGRVRFNLIDPVGLGQNFAGFMHLADFDEALVGSRILTDAEQINQRLADLTDHMETVIQKYLRNEFETIDDYNAQAGELAEPYRFLVIADFPVGFEGDAFRRLASIATSGARCGVYTLIARDTRHHFSGDAHLDDIDAHSAVLVQASGTGVPPVSPESDGKPTFYWQDDVYKQFPLTLDPPPDEQTLTAILHSVGKHAREAKRVEVPFDTIAPEVKDFWTLHSKDELRVPIGRMGATRLQWMRLGKGVAQHTLIAGKTGSGKSTLLHALVTNLAMWYSPDEVELYLIDFKKGVEFKTYATHGLPHARAIAVESDREFGLSVLQRLDAELTRRGELFRKIGVQDLGSYRAAVPDAIMPRTLLIIDEFQEFFTEDDKLAQDAALLLDRLVRQGRAFGVHVLLGSQTIGGSSGLSRSTIGQMAVRIALQTSEADSQLILGDGNSAARLLSRPGEAIYNDQGGLVEGNSPFQVAWLPDEGRDVYLDRVNQKLAAYIAKYRRRPDAPIVFEGNAPANIRTNAKLADLISAPAWPAPVGAPVAWLGDPVAIKDPAGVIMRRQSGANMMVIGQQEEQAISIMAAAVVSLAAQRQPGSAVFYVFDGSAADSPFAWVFPRLKEVLPHAVKLIEWRQTESAMGELAQELARRQAGENEQGPAVFAFIYGLQRYRMFRKQEESFSFSPSSGDEAAKPQADQQFADLIREGPPHGMHVLTWIDTPAAIDRTLDRGGMREFDNRILFQMSASDSSNLIDSPAANKLGFYRALAYSEEQGFMEKFRPYALLDQSWLAELQAKFKVRPV